MPHPEFWFDQAAAETPVMRGPGIEVSFNQGNGWGHSLRFSERAGVSTNRHGRWLVRADTALEQEIEPAEPRRIANPVYQAFVPHELANDRGPGLCALLTGSCFDHHFSAVFSLYLEPEPPHRVVLDVDVADRCRGSVDKLAATYIVRDSEGWAAPPGGGLSSVVWQSVPPGNGLLEFVAMPPSLIDEPTFSVTATRVQVQARIDPSTHTQRLHYRWRWASCPDLSR